MNRFLFLACACLAFVSRAAGVCCGVHGVSQQYFPVADGACKVNAGPTYGNLPGTAYYATAAVGSCTCPQSKDPDSGEKCAETHWDATSPTDVPDYANQVSIAEGYCTGATQISPSESYVFCIPVPGLDGDPHVTGFDGTRFEFHGVHGGVFNLISEEGLQLNMALDSFGQADATYIRSLGFKVGQDANIVISSVNATGALELSINGAQQRFPKGSEISNRVKIGSTEIVYGVAGTMQEFVAVKTAVLEANVKRNDGASHLDVDFVIVRDVPMHGVLGQTLKWVHSSQKRFEGDEADYLVSGLLADDFKYNMFQGSQIENRRLLRNAPEISVSASVGRFGKN